MRKGENTIPRIARYKPYYFKLVPGKNYLWCSCGLSARQPFCDNSHKGTGFEPIQYLAQEGQEEVLFCGCKHSCRPPFCDGTHNNLRDVYEGEDPNSEKNGFVVRQTFDRDGRYHLNGNTFVARPSRLARHERGSVSLAVVTTAAQGAREQSMFYAKLGTGKSPVFKFGARHVVLLATQGHGQIQIGSRLFEFGPDAGVYVRPEESFQVDNRGKSDTNLYVAVSPQSDMPGFPDEMTTYFDADYPRRVVNRDATRAERMGDRSFQILVDSTIGSDRVTQFIGTIPRSMAARHRHLYEETLIVLSGRGAMWTEDMKTAVGPGDVIFLPARQEHSLQCIDEVGMTVAGVIHPGGNPNINF